MIKNILFDWSGTLSDDYTTAYQATMIVFDTLGISRISKATHRAEFVLPYLDFYRKFIENPDKDEIDRVFIEAIYQVEQPKPYAGVASVLRKLHTDKINMVVLSSHPYEKLVAEARIYGFFGLFKEINGSVHDKIKIIKEILARNDFHPDQTIYIGDMVHDIDAGRAAGVKTVAITWGYQTEEQLRPANPDYLITEISQLKSLLQQNRSK